MNTIDLKTVLTVIVIGLGIFAGTFLSSWGAGMPWQKALQVAAFAVGGWLIGHLQKTGCVMPTIQGLKYEQFQRSVRYGMSPIILAFLLAGCITPAPIPTPPTPTPTPVPVPTPTPTPASSFRGVLFTPASLSPTLGNNNGVRSQMDWRDCHGQSNEGTIRESEARDPAALGGNVIIEIQGKSNYNNPVLDMIVNGRKHPQDGHYFPIADPLTGSGEVDLVMWYAQKYGITKRLTWIWNDDKAVAFNTQAVKDAVARYDGCRLGMANVWFGTCLETSEIASATDAAARLRDMRQYAPQSPIVVGSCPVDFLIAVKNAGVPTDAYYWLEQDAHGSPVTDPVTPQDWDAKIFNKAAALVKAGVKPDHVIIGEIWSPIAATRRAYTAKAEGLGYLVGSGEWSKP